MKSPLVMLMTATVDPGEYAAQLSRATSDLRTRDYLEAIRFWAAHPDARIQGVVFCENSGADLRIFESEAVRFSSTRALEVLGFQWVSARMPAPTSWLCRKTWCGIVGPMTIWWP